MRLRLVVLTAVFAATAAPAAAADTVSGAWTSPWFVELAGEPAADGRSPSALSAERSRFRAAAKEAGVPYRQRYAYDTLFNGVSIAATDEAVAELRRLDGVKAVHPVQTATLEDAEPSLAFALTMTGADIARSRLGYTGRGIHVAIMDSGVDYDHPDLGGCFGPGCRVSTGYDLVGDDYDEDESDPTWQPVPHPDPFPDDCNGHGTHVAGIVGASGAVTGVAPDVTLGAYRVFGCNGATSTDVMLAAMERIYRDGADVLNMSITETLNGWPQAPTAQAASRLVRKGVVVVAGAGNDRLNGLWTMGAPAVGEGVIAAASVDNREQVVPAISISPDDRRIAYLHGSGSAPLPGSGTTSDLARVTPDEACEALEPGSLAGKVALVRRGTCTFVVKGMNVAAAGAAGMVVYNNAGALGSVPPNTEGVPIPVVYVSQPDGELIAGRLSQGPVTMTWGVTATAPIPTAGLLSFFSSFGLAADLSLKPDIAAPGGFIRSTWPLEKGGHVVLSGTSMASPHVAGAAALLLQAGTRPRKIAAAMQNSADPVPWSDAPALGLLDPVARQGAGMLDVDDAILATTRVTPGKLSLGDGDGERHTLTIANRGRRAVTYALSHADALAVAGRDLAGGVPVSAPATVVFSRPSVTVPARGSARVSVRITASPALVDDAIHSGYLVVTPESGPPLRVPYAGYKGDYQAVPATTPTSKGFPWLARVTGLTLAGGRVRPLYEKQQAGATFSLAPVTLSSGSVTRRSADMPFVLLHLHNPARRIRVEAFSARRHVRVGALRRDHVPRNPVESLLSEHTLATVLPLDLRLRDGEYYVVATVERALAGRGTPEETWRSPTFRISGEGGIRTLGRG